jgi:hypothetical protein
MLPHALRLIPQGVTQADRSLDYCMNQLNQCVAASVGLLTSWQRCCHIGENTQLSKKSQGAFTHSCKLLASAVSSLHMYVLFSEHVHVVSCLHSHRAEPCEQQCIVSSALPASETDRQICAHAVSAE